MEEIERQATKAWHSTPYILDSILPASATSAAEVLQPGHAASSPLPTSSLAPPRGARAIAAYDFMTVSISLVQLSSASMSINAAAASDYEMFAGGSPRGGYSDAPYAGNVQGSNKRARDGRDDSRERRYERMVTEGRYGSGFGYGPEGSSNRGSGGGGRYDRYGDRDRGGDGYRGYDREYDRGYGRG